LERIELRFAIPGAGRFRQFVPTRRRFPIACRDFSSATLYAGAVLNPANSMNVSSSSGAPNVAFVQLVPMVSPQLLHCLRDQYAGLSTDLFVSLPLVIRATAVGRSDAGEVYRSNTMRYTLTLRHTCGNGRVDDGESCDPQAGNACIGVCKDGQCSQNGNIPCTTNANCIGVCDSQGTPTECGCSYFVGP